MTLLQWMNLTIEQHRRLDEYLKEQNAELGIDIDGSRSCGRQLEFEKDDAEYEEEISLGGRPFKRRR